MLYEEEFGEDFANEERKDRMNQSVIEDDFGTNIGETYRYESSIDDDSVYGALFDQ